MAEKKKYRIALGTHAFETVDFSVHYNHLYCIARWAKDYDIIFVGKKGLDAAQARNQMVDLALSKECTHMFFMDADHLFPIEALPLLMESSDEAMVSGLVCKKGEGYPQVMWMVKGSGPGRKYSAWHFPLDGGTYEVGVCAFGCTLINLEKLVKLNKPYFRDTCEAGAPGEEPTNIRSDVNICNDFREKLKEKVFVDTRVLIGHFGYPEIVYPQNAEIHQRLHQTTHETRALREGQQGFWFEPLC